jgi:hypothetical protein
MINPGSYFSTWHGKPGATEASIDALETACGVQLPGDYKDFLRNSNGGEGRIGRLYVTFWRTEDLYRLNERQGIFRHLPLILGFATDGPDFYGFNKSSDPVTIVRIPLGDFRPEMWESVANSFSELLRKMKSDQIY